MLCTQKCMDWIVYESYLLPISSHMELLWCLFLSHILVWQSSSQRHSDIQMNGLPKFHPCIPQCEYYQILELWLAHLSCWCRCCLCYCSSAYNSSTYNIYCYTKSPKSCATHVNSASEHPSSSLVRLTQILSYLPFVSHRKEEELTFAASWEPVSPGTVTVCKKSIETWWPHALAFVSICRHKS